MTASEDTDLTFGRHLANTLRKCSTRLPPWWLDLVGQRRVKCREKQQHSEAWLLSDRESGSTREWLTVKTRLVMNSFHEQIGFFSLPFLECPDG